MWLKLWVLVLVSSVVRMGGGGKKGWVFSACVTVCIVGQVNDMIATPHIYVDVISKQLELQQ